MAAPPDLIGAGQRVRWRTLSMFRLVRFLLARLLALPPRRRRFEFARRLSWFLAPFAGLFATDEWRVLNSSREIAMWALVRAMNRDAIEFDPDLDVRGGEIIDEPGGLLLVSGHFRLAHLLVRYVHDRGRVGTMVRADPQDNLFVAGTRVPQAVLLRTPHVLVAIRDLLKRGEVVMLAIDSTEPVAHGFTVGPVHVSDATLRVAERAGAAVAFYDARMIGGRVRVTITRGGIRDIRPAFEKWLENRRIPLTE